MFKLQRVCKQRKVKIIYDSACFWETELVKLVVNLFHFQKISRLADKEVPFQPEFSQVHGLSFIEILLPTN